MIVSDLIRAVLALLLALLAILRGLPLGAVLGIVLCIEAVGAFFMPAELGLLPGLVGRDQLGEVNGVNTSISSAAQLIGQGLGGAILGFIGPVLLFVANGLSFGVSVISLLFLPRSKKVGGETSAESKKNTRELVHGLWDDLMSGYRLIFRSGFLKRVIAVGAVANFFLQPLSVLQVAWVRQVLHLGAFAYGLFGVALVIGSMVGGIVAAAVASKVPHRSSFLLGIALEGILLMALSVLHALVPDLLVMACLGVVFSVLNTIGATMLQSTVPESHLGRVIAPVVALNYMLMPLGALLAGIVASIMPLSWVFLVSGALCMASITIGFGMPKELGAISFDESSAT